MGGEGGDRRGVGSIGRIDGERTGGDGGRGCAPKSHTSLHFRKVTPHLSWHVGFSDPQADAQPTWLAKQFSKQDKSKVAFVSVDVKRMTNTSNDRNDLII